MRFNTTQRVLSAVAIILYGALTLPRSASADTHTWNGSSGNWNDSFNWVENDGAIPDVQDDIAHVTALIGGQTTITIAAPVTIGVLNIGAPLTATSNTSNYIIAGAAGNTVTFSSSSGPSQVNKTAGASFTANDVISAPVVLANDVVITNTAPSLTAGVGHNNYFQFGPLSGAVSTISGTGNIINNTTTGQFSITHTMTGNVGIINNSTTSLLYLNSNGANTHTGDTVLNAGSAMSMGIASNSTPLGTGTLRMNGALLFNASNAKTINNSVVIGPASINYLRGSTAARPLTVTGPITGTGTIRTANSAFALPPGIATSTTTNSLTNFRGDISSFEGTFDHETIVTTSFRANAMVFDGTTPESMDGSKAKFLMSGDTSGTNRPFSFGNAGVTTLKIGELSGTGGMVSQIAATNTGLEIGHLNTSTSFAGVITGSALNLTKVGAGTLSLTGSNIYIGTTTVQAGILSINSPFLADGADVAIASGAKLDLSYVGIDAITSLYLNGVQQSPGIYGVGGLGASFFTGTGQLNVTVGPPALHAGDFDSDGDVDGADFVAWQTNFPKASGATLAEGDADSDGDVDGADFVVWQTNFPFTPGPGAAPVPEPAAGLLLGLAAVGGGLLRTSRAQVANKFR